MRVPLHPVVVCALLSPCAVWAQFPYSESFDAVIPPALPAGWTSSQNRIPGTNDFTTTTSVPGSPPHAVLSTNATIAQELHSRPLDFSFFLPESVAFITRRSATHNARLVVEASIDAGGTYPFPVGDTLRNPGSTNYTSHRFALPETLAQESGVRLRWRVIPDPTGATGTLRIDDVVVTALTSHDVLVRDVAFSPLAPAEDDSVTCAIGIMNAGREPAQDFIVELYHDANRDSLPQATERIFSTTIVALLPASDTLQVTIPLGVRGEGEHDFIAVAVYPPDGNMQNNITRAVLTVGYRPRSVVVNEIMYAPAGGEPEWVELYNTREDSISLRGWFISDNVTSSKKLVTSHERTIAGGGYAVLTKDSTGLLEVHPGIAAHVINVPALPALNNTGDAVVVYDSRTITMDSLGYLPSWGGNSGGNSLERIDPLGVSTVPANWGTSRSATPARKNSLTRKDLDIAIDTVRAQPEFPVSGEALSLVVVVRNAGLAASPQLSVLLYEDANNDSVAQSAELVDSGSAIPLAPGGAYEAEFGIGTPTPGMFPYIAEAVWGDDEDGTNNAVRTTITVGHPRGSVRINEIMYAPPSGMPEWVELLNTGTDTISLDMWRIGNRSGSRYVLSPVLQHVAPDSLVVITKDSALLHSAYGRTPGIVIQSASLPTFLWNNTGDAVVLADSRNAVMDSVFYDPSWGGTGGTSLERIDPLGEPQDPAQWISSESSEGATPGLPNSAAVVEVDLRIVRVSPVTVPPGGRADIVCTVENAGRLPIASFDVGLFHDADGDSAGAAGERVAGMTVVHPMAYRDTLRVHVTWAAPPAGSPSVLIRVDHPADQRPRNNSAWVETRVGYHERSVVINEIMYAPFADGAEYVELLNMSDHSVDVARWQISDKPSSAGTATTLSFGPSSRPVPPSGFLLLASDSTIFARYPSLRTVDSALVVIARSTWPALNNDGDAIVLRDLAGGQIDSVHYQPAWHNPGVTDRSGRSLEKINPLLGSNDERAWSTCASASGGTPASRNSIHSAAIPSSSSLSFSPNPFSPDGDGWEDFTLIHYTMRSAVSVIRIAIYDVRGRPIRTLASNEPSGATGMVAWDGLDDEGRKARIGMYVVLLEGVDQIGGVVEAAKGVVVLAARL